MRISQFTGSPCGHHGTYTFYRGFRYAKDGISKILSLGEFFFVRISAEEDPCIGELQLLCANRNNEQHLSALRLYFLPEQTPDGRLSHHGEDEVLVASDRIVLKLDDLVTWITEEVEWNHGILAPQCKPVKDQDSITPPAEEDKKEGQEEVLPKEEKDNNNNGEKEVSNAVVIKDEPSQDVLCSKGTRVVVLSYQKYCRFRTILKRLDGGGEHWLQDPLIIALGGFAATNQNTRVLFCRDNFEHDELAHHELNCEYLAPTIKGKRKRRKTKTVRSTSPESNSSEECKVVELKNNQITNGMKQPPIKNEGEFLERLYRFMKNRNTPIHRVPHLGFKQIDLYIFYSFAQKLGGYDKITGKRLWKHVYDELGGNPGSTSAATCTRRHYEKLLLPFERYMDGIVYKPATRGKKSLKRKQEKENAENTNDTTTPVKTEPTPGTSTETNDMDTYNFTDSNHENSNSKDSNSNEFTSVCDEQTATNEAIYSDEDSKTVWSIQKQPENKNETDKEDTKAIKPLIIQKGQGETFAEKERKWDEIRRKNAAARKWVRQSRSSSRSCKTPVPDVPHFNGEKPASLGSDASDTHKFSQTVKVKSENGEYQPSQNVPTIPNHSQLSQDKVNPSVPSANHTISKLLPTVHSEAIQNVINKLENQKKLLSQNKETHSGMSCDKKIPCVKSEPGESPSKSWSGYPVHSSFQSSVYSHMETNIPGHLKNQIPQSYKAMARSEPDYSMIHTGRQSVGSMSASSAISGDTSANEDKPLLSQRRPSVIQHTEYAATTPSPTVSPKQGGSDIFNMCPKDVMQCVQFSNPKMNLPPNQPECTNNKVADWLTRGAHNVVACKTPSSLEKAVELHDKVMMPSSCKTPGVVGTGKIPTSSVKSKHNVKSCTKSPRSKYTTPHQRNSDAMTNGNYGLSRNEVRSNSMYQKTFHPSPASYNSVMSNPVSAAKYQQTANTKPEFYPSNPYFNQQKRFKCNNMPPVLSGVGTRPSLLPFVRQQTYRASPLSDIPKTTSTHNDYDSVVLDLSVKKKPTQPPPSRTVAPPVCTSPVPEGVCLDLSIKKKPNISNDNGIENITPPLPLSPNPQPPATPYLSSTLKPLPTLIAIQDFQTAAMESARHNYSSSSTRLPQMMNNPPSSSASGPPLVMPPTNAMYPVSTHSKMPQNIVNTMPVAYSKEIAKNLYMPSTTRHSQFSPYVIPPFFPSSWTSVVNANVGNPKQTNNSQTSPMAYKGMVNHSVFPKDYPAQYKSQFHPVLCKDNGHYPSNGK